MMTGRASASAKVQDLIRHRPISNDRAMRSFCWDCLGRSDIDLLARAERIRVFRIYFVPSFDISLNVAFDMCVTMSSCSERRPILTETLFIPFLLLANLPVAWNLWHIASFSIDNLLHRLLAWKDHGRWQVSERCESCG